ncbi:MAG: DUF72 domain-containing protein [Candidatus Bathyarchaeota archaeon]|jgi:uncharacterized protein YecE (DUF72 family)
MDKLLLGCSGWYYKDWVGPFYKEKTESKLAAYSKVFKTAEIDSSFYAYPSKGMVMGWLRYTKPDFIYSAKLPRVITHKKKLDLNLDVEKDLQRFCKLMEPLQLNGKLGCLLAQLPPSLKFDLQIMEDFLSVFPSKFRLAVEFRDESWLREETWRLLERYNVAYTIVDEPLLPADVKVTSDIAYVRWHGRGEYPWYNYHYRKEELEQWVPKVEETVRKAETTFGYFNNHYHAYAVKNCIEMMDMLSVVTPQQKEVKDTVKEYLETRPKAPPPKPSLALTAFIPEEINKMGFKDLLRIFMDNRRIKRAKGLKDEEVELQEVTNAHVKAKVRKYHVAIDVSNRLILHDCADWSRCAPVKQFCKHLGKVLMNIPENHAISILRRIGAEREKWEFKPYVA